MSEVVRTAQRWANLLDVISQEIQLRYADAAKILGGCIMTPVDLNDSRKVADCLRIRSKLATERLAEAFEMSEVVVSIRTELAKLRFKYGVNEATLKQQMLSGKIEMLASILANLPDSSSSIDDFVTDPRSIVESKAPISVLSYEEYQKYETELVTFRAQYQELEDQIFTTLNRKLKLKIPEKFQKSLGLTEA